MQSKRKVWLLMSKTPVMVAKSCVNLSPGGVLARRRKKTYLRIDIGLSMLLVGSSKAVLIIECTCNHQSRSFYRVSSIRNGLWSWVNTKSWFLNCFTNFYELTSTRRTQPTLRICESASWQKIGRRTWRVNERSRIVLGVFAHGTISEAWSVNLT